MAISPTTFRNSLTVLVCAPMLALAGYLTFFFWNLSPCDSRTVNTAVDAVEFGKYWLRRDEAFWRTRGIQSLTELNQHLEKDDCCTAHPIDLGENSGREWTTTLRLVKPDFGDERYEISFTSCRSKIRTNIARREH